MGDLSTHFSRAEFECRCGCGYGTRDGDVSSDLLLLLEAIRRRVARPVRVTSGCRCDHRNRQVGGARNSAHMRGTAADLAAYSAEDRYALLSAAFALGARGVGVAATYIHVDVDEQVPRPAAWGYGERG